MLRQDDFLKSQLVLEAWRQTLEYGGHLPACMVASCLMNRVRVGWGSHLEILQNISKFSGEDVQPNRDMYPSIWEPGFVRLLHEIETIYDGSAKDLSMGALYWCDLRRVNRPWFQDKIINAVNEDGQKTHSRVADCNTLVFFR